MIKKIRLKFSSESSKPKLEIPISPITVFVGPNNSGKSKVLVEIENYCKNGALNQNDVILDDIEFESYSEEEITQEIEKLKLPSEEGEFISPENIKLGKFNPSQNNILAFQVHKQSLINSAKTPNQSKNLFCPYFVKLYTLRLDGYNRINLINPQPAGDLQKPPQNHLTYLFRNDDKRLEVRRIVKDAFSKYFVIDPTNLGNLRIRLSEKEPKDLLEERGIHEKAVEFHKNALDIAQASDGVKAFTGIITTILAG